MVLLARHACLNGQKTKKWNRTATHTVQPGYWVHFTPPSPWKPSISWAWRVTTSPISEERVRLCPGSRVGRQKETFLFFHDKKTPTAIILQLTVLSLTWKQCESPTKTSMNSLGLKIICLSACLLSMRDAIHTFQLLFISAIAHISSTQCAAFVCWIRPIVWANPQPRDRDLSSLCLYAHREIHFSSFITAQARITITCPFLYSRME